MAFSIISLLTVNSLLCVFLDGYYPTFGKYRLFSVVTNSMEPTIPEGSIIVCTVPNRKNDIKENDIITFEIKRNGEKTLYTHRVIEIHVSASGAVSYTTKGDNAPTDGVRPKFGDVVGVYTGDKCGFFGYIIGFLQSAEGAIAMIITDFIAVLSWALIRFVNLMFTWRKKAQGALDKSREMLTNTRNEQMGEIADVIGIITKDPADKNELKRKDQKLDMFIATGTLPKRPYSDNIGGTYDEVFLLPSDCSHDGAEQNDEMSSDE